MMVDRLNRSFHKTALALSIACVSWMGVASAADSGAAEANPPAMTQQAAPQLSPEQMKLMSEFKSTHEAIGGLEQQLQVIEDKAYKKNPRLVKDRNSLRDAIKASMSGKDYDAQTKYDELKSMVTKIQSMQDSDPEKAKAIQAFRAGQQEFEQRQEKAFQDPKIQKKSEKLRNDVRAEMIKVDPKSKALFADLDKNEQKMRELQQQAMKMHGSAQPMAPAGK
ncbi:MAG: hypothetical protein PF483_08290 [Halothiobacillus sp.]|jgi:hypothetical protein|nr:hypothetical protein [Halothiobacillus sp.]